MKKRIFILGSRGYIGSHLSDYYKSLGHSVFDSHAYLLRIENINYLKRILKLTSPDILIHTVKYPRKTDPGIITGSLTSLFTFCRENAIQYRHLSCDLTYFEDIPDAETREGQIADPGRPHLAADIEEIIKSYFNDSVALIRTAPVWSENVGLKFRHNNFLALLYRAFDTDPLVLNNTVRRGLTHWKTLAEGILQITEPDTYHFSEKQCSTAYRNALAFAAVLNVTPWLVKKQLIPSSEQAETPHDFILPTEHTEHKLNIPLQAFEEKVRFVLEDNSFV